MKNVGFSSDLKVEKLCSSCLIIISCMTCYSQSQKGKTSWEEITPPSRSTQTLFSISQHQQQLQQLLQVPTGAITEHVLYNPILHWLFFLIQYSRDSFLMKHVPFISLPFRNSTISAGWLLRLLWTDQAVRFAYSQRDNLPLWNFNFKVEKESL